MEEKRFLTDQKGKKCLRTHLLFLLAFFCFAAGVVWAFFWLAAVALISTAISAWLYLRFFYINRYLASFELVMHRDHFTLRRGVFIRQRLIFPESRLIILTEFKTPLAKRLGLRTLIFNAARAKIIFPLVSESDAIEISRNLGLDAEVMGF